MNPITISEKGELLLCGIRVGDKKDSLPPLINGVAPKFTQRFVTYKDILLDGYPNSKMELWCCLSVSERVIKTELWFFGDKQTLPLFFDMAKDIIINNNNFRTKIFGVWGFMCASDYSECYLAREPWSPDTGKVRIECLKSITKDSSIRLPFSASEKMKKALLALATVLVLGLMYCALSNHRYMNVNGRVFDKWTRTTSNGYGRFK